MKQKRDLFVIWSSSKMLKKISSKFTSHDATYKLNWNEYPVFVSGISTPTGVFFQTYMALSSHEDTTAWSYIFKFHKSVIGTYPKFCMADGAWEITNAVKDIFGNDTTRLMCWSHTYRCIKPKLAGLRKINKKLGDQVLDDIKEMQRLIISNDEFLVIWDLFSKKYMDGSFTREEQLELAKFFNYCTPQWGPGSHVSNWWEGAHAFHTGNNQGIASRNKSMKEDFSYRERLPMSRMIEMNENIIRQLSLF